MRQNKLNISEKDIEYYLFKKENRRNSFMFLSFYEDANSICINITGECVKQLARFDLITDINLNGLSMIISHNTFKKFFKRQLLIEKI